MSQPRNPKKKTQKQKLREQGLQAAENGSHPADVSGIFQDDPTFVDFRRILVEQRIADYRQAKEEIQPPPGQEGAAP
ncbi:MAG TPA: hypothetical protein VGP68_18985, partial [Gemmataceae bacterium]|nr:hypothetical protein [Gemmataceae bacterium]